MFKNSISSSTQLNKITLREQNTFIKKLREHLHQEIHLKMEQDDGPVNYILKEIGKDYIVVLFAHMERIVPFQRIIYFQTETSEFVPASSI